VADTSNGVIRKLVQTGTGWSVMTLSAWTGGALVFNNPRAVAVDSVGNFYVVDDWKRVWKGYSPDRLLNPRFIVGQFGFDYSGLGRIVVEVSSDLQRRQSIATNTITPGIQSLWFSDGESGAYPRRFYRTRSP
jgi:hypothetical protein